MLCFDPIRSKTKTKRDLPLASSFSLKGVKNAEDNFLAYLVFFCHRVEICL